MLLKLTELGTGTQKGQKHDEKRNADYIQQGFKVIIVETELLNFLEISPEQYIVPCLYQMKIFNNLKVDF